MERDIYFMQLAIEEAEEGRGDTRGTNWCCNCAR